MCIRKATCTHAQVLSGVEGEYKSKERDNVGNTSYTADFYVMSNFFMSGDRTFHMTMA